jgi:two-component system, OmpR family, response regulator MprA
MASSLLVVDDDDGIRSLLEREGFRVTVAGDGERALDLLRRTPVDCILLDAGPPGLEGLEVCRRLRNAGDDTPIILLTAPAVVGQRVQGLEAGADDCLGRPFALEELLARVRAVLRRRRRQRGDQLLRLSDLVVDRLSLEVSRGGRPIHLTRRELELLLAFSTGRARSCGARSCWPGSGGTTSPPTPTWSRSMCCTCAASWRRAASRACSTPSAGPATCSGTVRTPVTYPGLRGLRGRRGRRATDPGCTNGLVLHAAPDTCPLF